MKSVAAPLLLAVPNVQIGLASQGGNRLLDQSLGLLAVFVRRIRTLRIPGRSARCLRGRTLALLWRLRQCTTHQDHDREKLFHSW